jgi:hypothetical protein
MSDWLKELRAGDLVVRASGYASMSMRLVTVSSVTATIVRCASDLGVEEYSRAHGKLRGNTGIVRLAEATPEARARIRAGIIANRLSGVEWDSVSPDVLEQVAALVGKAH